MRWFCVCQFESTKYEAKWYLPIKKTITTTHNIHIKYHEWFLWDKSHTNTHMQRARGKKSLKHTHIWYSFDCRIIGRPSEIIRIKEKKSSLKIFQAPPFLLKRCECMRVYVYIVWTNDSQYTPSFPHHSAIRVLVLWCWINLIRRDVTVWVLYMLYSVYAVYASASASHHCCITRMVIKINRTHQPYEDATWIWHLRE